MIATIIAKNMKNSAIFKPDSTIDTHLTKELARIAIEFYPVRGAGLRLERPSNARIGGPGLVRLSRSKLRRRPLTTLLKHGPRPVRNKSKGD